jgi:predicted DNA-binding transcriptional regulator YafY
MRAIQGVLTINMPTSQAIDAEILARFSIAAYQHWRIWIEYRGGGSDRTQREVDVYGLVYHAGNWYSVGYCHLRQDLRSFRLDRVQTIRLLTTQFEPPSNFDALGYLLDSIARVPGVWSIEVLLKTTLEAARRYIPNDMAILEPVPDGVIMTLYTDNLDWIARFLLRTAVEFKIYQPSVLRDRLREIALSVVEMVSTE